MSSIPEFNFPAFEEAEARLKELGHEPRSPASVDNRGEPWESCMKTAITLLMDSDSIILLPGWEKSKGALVEYELSRTLGYPAYLYPTLARFRETAAQEAHRITTTARQASYGLPEDDYRRTVGAFNALTGKDLTINEGLLFMTCVKLSRQQHAPKHDNVVDCCGYQNLIDQIAWRQLPPDSFPEGLGCAVEAPRV